MQAEKFELIPMPGRVAVAVMQPAEVTEGGIIIPDVAVKENSTVGEVIATCEEYEQDEEQYSPLFKVGDVIVFGKYTGSKVTMGRKTVIVMRENDVIARLRPSEKGEDIRRVKVNDRT